MLEPGANGRCARADEQLVGDDQRRADDHVRPHDAAEARRDEREHDDLRDDAGGDDPRVPRLPA